MHRRSALLTAAACAAIALVPSSSALAQGAPDSGPGVPAGQIEYSQTTVQVTGSNAVPRFERSRQYLTTHSSHTITTTIATGKVRFEGVTSPRRELRWDGTTNRLTVAKGSNTPPYQSIAQQARLFAQSVALGCWTANGDTVFEGRSATVYKLVAATTGPCRGDAQVGQAVIDKATGAILEREAGEADGSFKQVEVLERFGTLPLNPQTAKLMHFHSHRSAKRVEEGAKKQARSRR
jgi:hypothetical protein